MAKELKEKFPSWKVFAPSKFSDDNKKIKGKSFLFILCYKFIL